MEAQMACNNLRRMTASMCVADEIFCMGVREIFGDYRFLYRDFKLTKDVKVEDPYEKDDMCGGPMWFVPEGWPLGMLVAYRAFKFRAKILRFGISDAWDVEAHIGLDRYDHEMRKGWEPMYFKLSYNRTDCDKKEEVKLEIDRRSTPTGLWIATIQEVS